MPRAWPPTWPTRIRTRTPSHAGWEATPTRRAPAVTIVEVVRAGAPSSLQRRPLELLRETRRRSVTLFLEGSTPLEIAQQPDGSCPRGGGPGQHHGRRHPDHARATGRATQIIEEESNPMTTFAIECFQNEFLATGRRHHACSLDGHGIGHRGAEGAAAWSTEDRIRAAHRGHIGIDEEGRISAAATQGERRPPWTASLTACPSGSSVGTTRRR